MTIWYLDYENCNSNTALDLLVDEVKKGDTVIAFYSSTNPNVPFRFLRRLEENGGKLKVFNCFNGSKNAMDFQIVMELAYNCATMKPVKHRVYSKDTGYIIPLKSWAQKGYDVGLVSPSEHDKTTVTYT